MQLPTRLASALPSAAMHRGAVVSIAAGIVLFVFASLTSATATPSEQSKGRPVPVTTPAEALPSFVYSPAPTTPAAVPVKKLTARPVTVAKQAPANSAVISGLASNGIPTVALNAYRVAAARLANVDPSCGIDWALLAGIGREESDHGRFGGAVLHADGTSSPRIIGPALDGKVWDYIAAPANGKALDGDAVYSHALGPMQFIPSTWAEYGVDGNGDGKADIFNINDAALTAARYLCAAGGNLHTHAGQVRAVLAYNHNNQYLAQVLALAAAYRSGVRVTGIPVGVTSGALPPVHNTGSAPPANPGGPTAVDQGTTTGTAKSGTAKSGSTKTGGTKSGGTKTATPKGGTSTSGSSAGATASSSPKSGGSTSAKSSPSSSPSKGSGGSSSKPTPTPSPTCKVALGKICLVK
ncbi:lytic murein transglycosylase [Jatrophihabitans sp.]|uniref:lytic transglycosylase domain-containing protein n=1 Tax=Jatrophihabitans sp. TaxID=1932789 RepID=UPI0030C74242|nr:hypothetical protein [Jatrophihabitans sp.]